MPLQDVAESGEAINSIANPQALRVLVFPGADGSFVMREDRGTWGAPSADTAIAFTWGGADASPSAFTVAPVTGDTSAVPELRDWTVVFRGVARLTRPAACVHGPARLRSRRRWRTTRRP